VKPRAENRQPAPEGVRTSRARADHDTGVHRPRAGAIRAQSDQARVAAATTTTPSATEALACRSEHRERARAENREKVADEPRPHGAQSCPARTVRVPPGPRDGDVARGSDSRGYPRQSGRGACPRRRPGEDAASPEPSYRSSADETNQKVCPAEARERQAPARANFSFTIYTFGRIIARGGKAAGRPAAGTRIHDGARNDSEHRTSSTSMRPLGSSGPTALKQVAAVPRGLVRRRRQSPGVRPTKGIVRDM